MKAILDRVAAHKGGRAVGIHSVCSAHPLVIEAAMRLALVRDEPVLIEATSNQVNQFGGYTGMQPRDFRAFALGIAARLSFPEQRLLLGGDHLGPNAWQSAPADQAIAHAERLVGDYVLAGFRKIHLDCSMSCADDPRPLPEALVAERAARLCAAAERAWAGSGGAAPVYVVGTEVPVPGGAHEELGALAVTSPAAASATLEAHARAFAAAGLQAAWARVVALVVQPGVEFDHHKVIDYDPAAARALSRSVEAHPGIVFEAHSTDYQTPAALAALVRDHFAILKVGPGLTFALREALWALDDIAQVGGLATGESLKQAALRAMRADPRHWQTYYVQPARRELDLQYSLSDRIRYYWSVPAVAGAVERLMADLQGRPLPLTLLSQYLPRQYAAVRERALANDAHAIVVDAVNQVLRPYAQACQGPVQAADGRMPGESR
jgi:D-tagatose-1,6-bisphosphate aldolase subunit GatZ/KbaZ